MAQSLTDDFRTPPRWVEAKSADTWENARFSADILRAEGITSVYVVTHAWHMRRAVLAFQGTGLTVTVKAAVPPGSSPVNYSQVAPGPRQPLPFGVEETVRPELDPDAANAYPGAALYGLMRSQQHRAAGWKTDLVRKSLTYYRPWWQKNKNMAFVPWQTAAFAEAFRTTREPA